jgi:TonB family protein
MKKVFWICLVAALPSAHSQTEPKPVDASASRKSLADFGLAYPLSNDWILATEMSRERMESGESPQKADVLLSAVYVPKSNLSATNPFFTLLAYRQPATDCKRSLELSIAHPQVEKPKASASVKQFSAAGREFYRLDLARSIGARHQSIICTTANNHLLIWYAGASNEKGLDAVISTLDSITPLTSAKTAASAPTAEQNDDSEAASAKLAKPERVHVASGVTAGLLIKRVNPVYPSEARAAYIQGTVVLKAEISKAGDITNLELVSGPIELAGSAVSAVRQWKYRPYLLMGQPVTVETQIQVNYALSR